MWLRDPMRGTGVTALAHSNHRAGPVLIAGSASLAVVVLVGSALLGGGSESSLMALLILSAVLVALAQQTLP